MQSARMLAVIISAQVFALNTGFYIPPQLQNTPFGEDLRRQIARDNLDLQLYSRIKPIKHGSVEVPLDHFDPKNPARHTIRYWVVDDKWDGSLNAPLIAHMPDEVRIARADWDPSRLAAAVKGLDLHMEHRFFGKSTPGRNASTANLKFHTVEQNLADIAALVKHVRQQMRLSGPTVAVGGSYGGATTAWFRTRYPEVADAGVAESASIHAIIDLYEYDQHLSTALSEMSSECEAKMAAVVAAIDNKWEEGATAQAALKRQFHQESSIGTPMGDADFFYMLGDSLATLVQYGNKKRVCDSLSNLPTQASTKQLIAHWANFTHEHYGKSWASSECYNSEIMADPVMNHGNGDCRAWYWLKCSELAYLQTAPPKGPRMRSKHLTVELLLQQCHYIFPNGLPDQPRVEEFNEKFGGLHPEAKNATKVLFLRFGDDPWQAAQPKESMSAMLPLVLTEDKSGSCAHCGAGCHPADITSLNVLTVKQLTEWGILSGPSPPSPGPSPKSPGPTYIEYV